MKQSSGRSARWARRLVPVALLIGMSGCTSSAPTAGPTLSVVVRDFRIVPAQSTFPAGRVTFQVHDRGPSTHEFVVVRTDLPPDALPLRADGLTVDEDSPLLSDVGEITDLDMGDSAQLVLHLTPGRYVLFCNLEGHYLGGMHAQIDVGPGGGTGEPGS